MPARMTWFMQLNPARGRKPHRYLFPCEPRICMVYAAQPREGTETDNHPKYQAWQTKTWFMQLNPARGRKLADDLPSAFVRGPRFMQLNPARGRKLSHALPSTTLNASNWFMQLNPARGRKHDRACTQHPRAHYPGFMQLNPARGRKHLVKHAHQGIDNPGFMQLNPARGRKRSGHG